MWRQLQQPFEHASLSDFKYTLTCTHPLMWVGAQKCQAPSTVCIHLYKALYKGTPTQIILGFCIFNFAVCAQRKGAVINENIGLIYHLAISCNTASAPTRQILLEQFLKALHVIKVRLTCPQGPTCQEAHSCCWHVCTDSGLDEPQKRSSRRSSPN